MALDKSKTSTPVKVVLIFLIIAFVMSFVSIGTGLFGGNQGANNTPSGDAATDPLAAADAKYAPTVSSLTAMLQSDPTSYTALVQLGNTYFDWAIDRQQASQTTTSAVGTDQPLWVSAKDAYSRALEVQPGDPAVTIDYAIVNFYSGETNKAIELAQGVTKSDPEFAPAWFNLGIFYSSIGREADSKVALEKYLELDPQGQQGDPAYAEQLLQGGTAPAK